MNKSEISEKHFARICRGIVNDRDVIFKHNPIGTKDETLLWMLMSVLISYLSIEESEMPCFPGKAGSETYRNAIEFILKDRKTDEFSEKEYLDEIQNC